MFTVENLTESEAYLRDVRGLIAAAPAHIRPWLHDAESALLRAEQDVRRERQYRARLLLDALGTRAGGRL